MCIFLYYFLQYLNEINPPGITHLMKTYFTILQPVLRYKFH